MNKKITNNYVLLLLVATLFALAGPVACAHRSVPLAEDAPACPDFGELPGMGQFMVIRSAESPQLAPDGRLYFITWTTGVKQVYQVSDEGPRMLTGAEEFPEGVDGFSLSPDGRYLIIEADIGGDEQYSLYRLDLIDAPGTLTPVDVDPQVKADTVVFAPDSSAIYYRSNRRNGRDFDIWRATMDAPPQLWIETEGYLWLNDVSPDGTQLAFVRYHGGDMADLLLADLVGRRVRNLTKLSEETQGVFGPAFFTADGEHLVLVTDAELERRSLARMRLADATWEPVLESDWAVEGLAISPDRRRIAYTLNEHGYSRTYHSPVDEFSPTRLEHPGLSMIGGILVGDDALWLVGSSASRTAEIYRLPFDGGEPVQLTFSDYGGIDTGPFVEPELVSYTSFDGLEIPAFLYRPKGGGAPRAYVVYAHGGPEAQSRPGFIRSFQFLLTRGIGILAPNVRGSSGYTREYLDLDNYTRRMDSVRDYKAAADWLIEQGLADPKRLGIMGGSYGGFIVMACVTEYPELFAAGVNTVGIVNFITYFENTQDYRRKVREREYGPADDVEFLRSISPIFKIDEVVTPLFVVHGENDPRVPVIEARQIVEALEARGRVIEHLIFPDEGHGIAKLTNRILTYDRMADFLLIHLLGVSPACLERPESSEKP